jgi:D-beta-D-heptose 7-phosphate kinase / D-beta-D-heptose 1-phosphate adenosyltransferase
VQKPHSSVFGFEGRRILVIGDVMLDRFVAGSASRVSPEAPIPVLLIEEESAMPGGAANVACNIASLGGEAVLVGVIGADRAGEELRAIMEKKGILADLLEIKTRKTTQKIRYIAGQQQLLRADVEQSDAVNAQALEEIIKRHLPRADAVVLSDYAKGVLSVELLSHVIAAARKAQKPVIVDPKSADIGRYDGATVITPNHGDAAAITNIPGIENDEVAAAAKDILDKVPQAGAVIVTRGSHGMTLAERGKAVAHYPAASREVFDVSGAGDTVIATLALSLAAGHSLAEATIFANAAAGVVVGKRHTATLNLAELRQATAAPGGAAEFKIVGREQASSAAAEWRAAGKKIGFTNGCFDLLHPGHISLLEQARAQCDHLIVGLNSDASVRRLKGEGRPLQGEDARAIMLGSLGAVDLVVLFGEDTPLELIRAIRPDVLVKGSEYTVENVVGAAEVAAGGGRVFLADLVPGHSTSGTISRLNPKSAQG